MEEEAARQAAANVPPPPPSAAPAPAIGSDGAPAQTSQPAPAADEDEEAILQQALALSEGRGDVEMNEGGGEEELTEEEMIARAIEMSMNPENEEKKK